MALLDRRVLGSVRLGLGNGFQALLFLLILIGRTRPLSPSMIAGGFDPSWVSASVYALLKGYAFGPDFAFTMGPYSALYTGAFAGPFTLAFSLIALFGMTILAIAFSAQLTPSDGAMHPVTRLMLGALAAMALLWGVDRDSAWLIFPVVIALLLCGNRPPHALVVTGLILAGVLGLAKFSIFPLACGSFIMADLQRVLRGRVPYAVPLFAISSAGWFMAIGQDLRNFPDFILASIDVSSFYPEGVAYSGWLPELLLWAGMFALLVLIAAIAEFRGILAKRHHWAQSLARVAILVGLGLILAKAGFVRQDAHTVKGWTGLALGALLFLWPIGGRGSRIFAGATAVVSTLCGMAALFSGYHQLSAFDPRNVARTAFEQMMTAVEIASDPKGWSSRQDDSARAAAQRLAAATPLPSLSGTIDTIPSMQSEVIANGLDYRPRPSVQEYTTFSPALFARNRAFFEGEDAPGYLLFAPGSLDRRYPASAEGALWPLLMERYEPVELVAGTLLMSKRLVPRTGLAGQADARVVANGEWIELPVGTPLFISVKLKRTLAGQFANAVFKPPSVSMSIRFPDRTERRFRLITGEASEGFMIAPYVATAGDILMLMTSSRLTDMTWPTAVRVDVGSGSWAYEATAAIALQPLDLSRVR